MRHAHHPLRDLVGLHLVGQRLHVNLQDAGGLALVVAGPGQHPEDVEALDLGEGKRGQSRMRSKYNFPEM